MVSIMPIALFFLVFILVLGDLCFYMSVKKSPAILQSTTIRNQRAPANIANLFCEDNNAIAGNTMAVTIKNRQGSFKLSYLRFELMMNFFM